MFDDDVLRPGGVIDGRFTLVEPLGRGAFGAVWRALDAASGGQQVAIKILHPQAAEGDAAERMCREADVLERLDHPNIARPIAFSTSPDLTYLAMELVNGMPLHEHMAVQGGQPYSLRAVARMFGELCSALAYAHARAVVHRDLKPQNVMIAESGVVKVLDFGVAKILEGQQSDGTTQGRTIGSLFYLSPEQTRGDPATTSSDIFALGSMLFELLTLRRAWAHDRAGAALQAFTVPVMSDGVNALVHVVDRIVRGARPRPSTYRADLPLALDAVVARAVAIEPNDRHPSVDALREETIAALGFRELDELTMVRPRDVGESSEEELSTVGHSRGSPKTESGPVLVPTRRVPGGVSSLIADKTQGMPLPVTADDSGVPTLVKGEVPTLVYERHGADPRLPQVVDPQFGVMTTAGGQAPWPGMAPSMHGMTPSVHGMTPMGTPVPARRWPMVVGMVLGAAALVITTYAITRASYEGDPRRGEVVKVGTAPATGAPLAVAPPILASPAASPTSEPTPAASPTAAGTRAADDARAGATRAPATSPPRKPAATPSPTAAEPRSELAELLAQARKAPSDGARLAALAAAITRAAQKVPDATARTNIRRIASSSAMVGNFEGLEQAHRDLVQALKSAGEPIP